MHLGSHGFYVQDHAGESVPAAMANAILMARMRDQLKREAQAEALRAIASKLEERHPALKALKGWYL